jgi:dephospho-CoA kinase
MEQSNMMNVIGLTGGIACGKSTVSSLLKEKHGAFIIDADQIIRELSEPGGKIYHFYRDLFGEEFFHADGSLNKKMVAHVIFSDEAKRKHIGKIAHPMVKREIEKCLQTLSESGMSLVVIDCPLMFESGVDALISKLIVVTVQEKVQIERLMARNHLTEAEAVSRIRAQVPQKYLLEQADYVIHNEDRSLLETQIEAIIESLQKTT